MQDIGQRFLSNDAADGPPGNPPRPSYFPPSWQTSADGGLSSRAAGWSRGRNQASSLIFTRSSSIRVQGLFAWRPREGRGAARGSSWLQEFRAWMLQGGDHDITPENTAGCPGWLQPCPPLICRSATLTRHAEQPRPHAMHIPLSPAPDSPGLSCLRNTTMYAPSHPPFSPDISRWHQP